MPIDPDRPPASAAPSGAARPDPAEIGRAAAGLRAALAAHRLELALPVFDRFAHWLALLLRWRAARRLTGPSRPEDLAVEAVVDALFVAPLFPAGVEVVDVGSGAGLPGIPLALLDPKRRVRLVEPAPDRAALLRLAAASLGLGEVTIRARRGEAEAAAVEAGEASAAGAAVARAFLPPDEWLALGRRLVEPGGSVVVLAGADWPGPRPADRAEVAATCEYRPAGRRVRRAWKLIPRP